MTRSELKMRVFRAWRTSDDHSRRIDLWKIAWREIDLILRPAVLPDLSTVSEDDLKRWTDQVRERVREQSGPTDPGATFSG